MTVHRLEMVDLCVCSWICSEFMKKYITKLTECRNAPNNRTLFEMDLERNILIKVNSKLKP